MERGVRGRGDGVMETRGRDGEVEGGASSRGTGRVGRDEEVE